MQSLYLQGGDEVRQRLRPYGVFFEKSLKDLITGIRSHNETPEQLNNFLDKELAECRTEINSANIRTKANAVSKLTYLEMYGYDMSWCNFQILEVMSNDKLQNKRIGYLAASQSFYRDPDILVLMTNLLRKDLKYANQDDMVKVRIALSGISTIITSSLATDIAEDLITMLNSSKPYIRKRTVAALFKVFLQYPEALRDHFDKFTSKLHDDDMSVVSATVSVICELSKHNPYPFIPLSPLLYELLLNINNNWIVIRLLKLFTNLSKVEPKLKYKLLPNIIDLINSTSATSVLYESINCIVKGEMLEPTDLDTALLCLNRLHEFCESQDPNLRYISCLLFHKIGLINKRFVANFDSLILKLISDVDVSIRSRAIELLDAVIDSNNLRTTVTTLMKQFVHEENVIIENNRNGIAKDLPIFVPNSYKIKVVEKILNICFRDNYENIDDFEWYNTLLIDLTYISQDLVEARDELGKLLGEQLKSIIIKIPDLRPNTISTLIQIISIDYIHLYLPTILKDCIWSLGEFAHLIANGNDLIRLLLDKNIYLNMDTKVILIPAILKLFAAWSNHNAQNDLLAIKSLLNDIIEFLEVESVSKYFEIQERSIASLEILKLIQESLDMLETNSHELPILLTEILPSFFNGYELKPISRGTQLQLQQNYTIEQYEPYLTTGELNNLLLEHGNVDTVSDNEYDTDSNNGHDTFAKNHTNLTRDYYASDTSVDNELGSHFDDFQEDEESVQRAKEQRAKEQLSNPFYLGKESAKKSITTDKMFDNDVAEKIEIVLNPNDNSTTKKKKKKKVKVLSDEVIVEPSNTSNPTPNPVSYSTDGINLKVHSKLENFNFHNDSSVVHNDEQDELDKIRKKLEQQSMQEHEVVVVKKKKKRKSKKKHTTETAEKGTAD